MSNMDYCIICGKLFDEKNMPSKEHIIPEALGNEKIVTYNVCEHCNNKLGTVVDSYLTDYIAVKILRRLALEKDKDLPVFQDVLPDENQVKHKVRNDSVKRMTTVDATKLDNGAVHFHVETGDYEEGIEQVKKKLKRIYKDASDEDIEAMLNRDGAIKRKATLYYRPTLRQKIDIDRTRWCMAAIKMAYEYTVEKIGKQYLFDENALIFRSFLYAAVQGEKNYSDSDYQFLLKYCCISDFRSDIQPVLDSYKYGIRISASYSISIEREDAHKMVCRIRIFDNNLLAFKILLSENVSLYLNEGIKGFHSEIGENGVLKEW